MPQSERTEIMKKLLKWLESKKEKGATLSAIITHTKVEITLLGATTNTIKKYVDDLGTNGLIHYKHPFWKISEFGKEWLERYYI